MKTLSSFSELPAEDQELLLAAEEAVSTAYAPYSGFSVGAAVRSASTGRIIAASNVENAAYIMEHAEEAVIARANAEGVRDFESLAITTRRKSGPNPDIAPPCGNCRQLLAEFAQLTKQSTRIILSNTEKTKIVLTSAEELLPLGFSAKDLG